MTSSSADPNQDRDVLEVALQAVGADVRLAELLLGLEHVGAIITLRDGRGGVRWESLTSAPDDVPEQGASPSAPAIGGSVRVFSLEGRELPLSDGPGYHARISGGVEVSRVMGLRRGDEPVRWVKISSLPISRSDDGWSAISIAFDVEDVLTQTFTDHEAVLASEVGVTARETPHNFVKLEDSLEAVGASLVFADFLYRFGDAGNLITIRDSDGKMEWTSGNIWADSAGAGQPRGGGGAARYLTADGQEVSTEDQAPQRTRRSGIADPAAVVGVSLRGELRWIKLAIVPVVSTGNGWSVITVGIDVTAIAGQGGAPPPPTIA